jgi:hypothetical protein
VPVSARSLLSSTLELAAGGTVFLDAMDELSLDLLRGIDAMVGGAEADRESPPDVRVIAATTREPRRAAGREEVGLVRRLSDNCVKVPPLVDRHEDVPALVEHFVRRYARQIGKVIDVVSGDSLERLTAYGWPGNIRELRTVVERAVLLSKSTVLEIDEDLLDDGLAIGSYRLVQPLGAGGMGEVWRARHRLLARPAAVKLIRHDVPPGTERDQLVRRFQREAQVTSALRSPHTVQLYDFGVNDSGSFYYVMEFLEGLDLHRIVSRFGPQPAERVVFLLRQACRSLDEAHERGLVHRDIKPANLFVTRLGTEYDYLKLLDFGVVKDQSAPDATLLSNQSILQGTPAFMAPEIALGESRIDGRSDLYSLACSAYWALTGQTLFEANTLAQMLLHHAQTRPVPPSERSELPVPKALESVLMACLEKDPAQRVPSAAALDAELARVRCDPWTKREAQAWWRTHAPDSIGLQPA